MNDNRQNFAGSVTGPIMLIAVGSLFAVHQLTPYHIGQTWPFLLILLGVLELAKRLSGDTK